MVLLRVHSLHSLDYAFDRIIKMNNNKGGERADLLHIFPSLAVWPEADLGRGGLLSNNTCVYIVNKGCTHIHFLF